MAFNSAVFLIFISVFFLGWKLLEKHIQLRWIYLTAASFFFYGWWNWRFLGLLVLTGTVDYMLGRAFDYVRRPARRKALLAISVTTNLLILFSFKYSVFIAENLESGAKLLGSELSLVSSIPSFLLILPIGISFYTFESLSYTIDIYKGHIRPARNIFHFFAFLSMFPRLVAGPIERPANLLPQLLSPAPLTPELRWRGLVLITQGYFKKTVIADHLAPVVNATFASAEPVSTVGWWLAMFAFSIQIYCDFSGYSDIARGLANWLGFDFRLNFDHPYRSLGFSDFWRRWHISLSSWFRDYVYIPLGGGRAGGIRSHFNLWITMLASGFWHGAQWTFVVWGGIHALFLSIERLTDWPGRFENGRANRLAGVIITFLMATVAWVFFRAATIDQAFLVLKRMFWPSPGNLRFHGFPAILLGGFLLKEVWAVLQPRISRIWILPPMHPAQRVWLAVLLFLCVYARGPGSTFIYFQF